MLCIKICFWSRSRSEPSFYRWSRNRIFLPGAGAEKNKSGAGPEGKWFGSATLLARVSELGFLATAGADTLARFQLTFQLMKSKIEMQDQFYKIKIFINWQKRKHKKESIHTLYTRVRRYFRHFLNSSQLISKPRCPLLPMPGKNTRSRSRPKRGQRRNPDSSNSEQCFRSGWIQIFFLLNAYRKEIEPEF